MPGEEGGKKPEGGETEQDEKTDNTTEKSENADSTKEGENENGPSEGSEGSVSEKADDPEKDKTEKGETDEVDNVEPEATDSTDLASDSSIILPEIDQESELDVQLSKAMEVMNIQHEYLKSTHFKDYDKLHELKFRKEEVVKVYAKCQDHISKVSEKMNGLRDIITSLTETIKDKMKNEEVTDWVVKPANSQDALEVTDEKGLIARAAKTKLEIAKASSDLAEAVEYATKMEAEADEAAAEAVKAAKEAEIAAKAAEQARLAAEEKAKAEEEKRRKEEEKRRQKEEEERKKKEEEEKKRKEMEKLKGTPEEMERRKQEEERARQERERRDPKNWPKFIYSLEDTGDFDQGTACIVRAIPGSLEEESDIVCEKIEQMKSTLVLPENEELISNVLQISAQEDKELKWEEPISVAIPHCSPKLPAFREPVVKFCEAGKKTWVHLPTQDVSFEDIRDPKFVECRLTKFGQLAVVTRLKKDTLTLTKKGGKYASSIDSRILITVKPNVFKTNATLSLQVQPVDLASVSDLKSRTPECEPLLTASPIVRMDAKPRKFPKAVSFTLPVPPNPKAKRPQTAAGGHHGDKDKKDSRPKSAFSMGALKQNEDEDTGDCIHFLTSTATGNWTVNSEMEMVESKKCDMATFDLKESLTRILILRTKPDIKTATVEKIANALDKSLMCRTTQFILRQRADDSSDVTVQCVFSKNTEKTLKKLTEDGYAEDDAPEPSKEITLKEGQLIEMRFRGNLKVDEEEERELKFNFNSQLKSRLMFYVAEIDKFAQKSFNCYRGFAQFYTKGMVEKKIPKDDPDKKNKQFTIVHEEGDVLLCEQLINLPKPEPESLKPLIQRAPVTYKSEGPIDEIVLRNLSSDLGDEWRKLAEKLHVKRMRIQAILRNNVTSKNDEAAIFDMLMTWAKRVPRCMDKVDILANALINVGRPDLAETVYEHDEDFRQKRLGETRDSVMRKAFVEVAKHANVSAQWKTLAKRLNVSDTQIEEVEEDFQGMRDRCFQSLVKWRENSGDDVDLTDLVQALKKCKFMAVAETVQCIG